MRRTAAFQARRAYWIYNMRALSFTHQENAMPKFVLIAAICLAAGATMTACDRHNANAAHAAAMAMAID